MKIEVSRNEHGTWISSHTYRWTATVRWGDYQATGDASLPRGAVRRAKRKLRRAEKIRIIQGNVTKLHRESKPTFATHPSPAEYARMAEEADRARLAALQQRPIRWKLNTGAVIEAHWNTMNWLQLAGRRARPVAK